MVDNNEELTDISNSGAGITHRRHLTGPPCRAVPPPGPLQEVPPSASALSWPQTFL